VDNQKAKEGARESGVAQVHDMRLTANKRPTTVSA